MKKYILSILLFMLFMPFYVNAETKTYEICQNGCEYDRFTDVIIDVNLLQENYDVVINFEDAGPYYLIKDEQDYNNIQTKGEEICTSNGGNWDGFQCVLDGSSTLIGGPIYIYNSKLSSITINGVKDKTIIHPTGIFSMSELLSNLTFPGILYSNFELNNLKFESSLYFASLDKGVYGKINNCDIKYNILVFGNENVEILNSKINNVYSLGVKAMFDEGVSSEEIEQYKEDHNLKDPIVIIDKNSTSFYKKYYKYSNSDIEYVFSLFEDFCNNNPEPRYNVPFPVESDYINNNEYVNAAIEWFREERIWSNEHSEEYYEWEAEKEKNTLDIINYLRSKKGGNSLSDEDFLEFISSFREKDIDTEDYKEFIENYLTEHPEPEEGSPDGYQWYKDFQLAQGYYIVNSNLFPKSFDFLLKIVSSIIFPGDDGTFSNMVGLADGKIYFKESKYKEIPINKNLSLYEIANELGTSIDGWEMSNNDIIKISNGKIIPLKVGSVELRKQTQDDFYVINIEITPDMIINPNTGTGISIIIIITILLVSSITYMIFKGRKIIL